MRKQGVNAGLSLRRIEDELRLPVFLEHGVIVVHGHRSIRIPANCRVDPKHRVIDAIRHGRRANHQENYGDEHSPQPHSQVRGRRLSHEARL